MGAPSGIFEEVADIVRRLFNAATWTGPTALALSMGWLLFLVIVFFWPASYWIEVKSVRVLDTYANQPVHLLVDQRIRRDFHGTWLTHVRVQRLNGGDELFCPSAGIGYYKKAEVLPSAVTLGWWTGGECETLPPGRYVVETTWTVEPDMWPLPPKRIRVVSNPFEVRIP